MTRGRRQGFTLVELLAATALFAIVATLLFQTVAGATDVWRRGERNRELEERAQAALQLIAEDLRHLYPGAAQAGEQEARLLCGWREQPARDDGRPALRVAALRFTRVLHEARRLAALRAAGDVPGGEPAEWPAGDGAVRPSTGGLGESLYTLDLLPGARTPTLLRAVRARAGGAGSLVEADLLERPDRALADAVPIADEVLHFGLLFEGEVESWDSTRALVAPDDDAFPWGVGPASLWDGSDDLFPRLVEIELVLDDGAVAGRLAEPLPRLAERLVLAAGGASVAGSRLRIDEEWVEVLGPAAGAEGALRLRRGVRGSRPADHEAGAAAVTGRAFSAAVAIPAARGRTGP